MGEKQPAKINVCDEKLYSCVPHLLSNFGLFAKTGYWRGEKGNLAASEKAGGRNIAKKNRINFQWG